MSSAALLAVIAGESRAQAAGLDADDRVGARVERRALVEDLHADDVFLQLIAAPLQRLQCDEAEKALEAIDLTECGAGQNAIQFLPRRRVGVLLGQADGPGRHGGSYADRDSGLGVRRRDRRSALQLDLEP